LCIGGPRLGHIISIVNNKGGVGKTTVAVNLAHALTRRGQRVLVIDMDAQCNATRILCPRERGGDTLYEVFTEPAMDIRQCIYPTEYEKLFCLPNTNDTSALESPLLKTLPDSCEIIRRRIRDYAQQQYDFALLDCPPNMGFFVVSALHASDFVIVPIWAGSAFSVEGLLKAVDLINDIHTNGHADLRFLRLLVNQVDRRTAMTRVSIDQLNKHFPADQIFKTMIPVNAAFQRAENERKTIIRYDPTTFGAKAYRVLAKELLEIFSLDGHEEALVHLHSRVWAMPGSATLQPGSGATLQRGAPRERPLHTRSCGSVLERGYAHVHRRARSQTRCVKTA